MDDPLSSEERAALRTVLSQWDPTSLAGIVAHALFRLAPEDRWVRCTPGVALDASMKGRRVKRNGEMFSLRSGGTWPTDGTFEVEYLVKSQQM